MILHEVYFDGFVGDARAPGYRKIAGTGGMDVIDFTKPTRLKEIAYYDPQRDSGTWSAYPYTGPLFKTGPGLPVYATDGVENNAIAQGMVSRGDRERERSGRAFRHRHPPG